MPPSPEAINELITKRNARYGQGFTQLDVKIVSSSQSAEIVFNDIGMNEYKINHKGFATFMRSNFESMRSLSILEEKTTGTAEFTAWEMLIQVEAGLDIPEMDIKAGNKTLVRGVALQWWSWEGPGDTWDGDLSEDEIKGWKIVREHDYMISLKPDSKGGEERLFDSF